MRFAVINAEGKWVARRTVMAVTRMVPAERVLCPDKAAADDEVKQEVSFSPQAQTALEAGL